MNYSDGSQRNIRFNGHSIDDANYTFDGIDNNGVQVQVVRRRYQSVSRKYLLFAT